IMSLKTLLLLFLLAAAVFCCAPHSPKLNNEPKNEPKKFADLSEITAEQLKNNPNTNLAKHGKATITETSASCGATYPFAMKTIGSDKIISHPLTTKLECSEGDWLFVSGNERRKLGATTAAVCCVVL
ncbi:hypothetical protein PMAYCL1PPCAC_14614, partial [Pristionchus mayeri]